MTDLLPCPFCGGKAKRYARANPGATFAQHDVDHWVSCDADAGFYLPRLVHRQVPKPARFGYCLASVGLCETAEEAAQMWNTRAPVKP